MNKGKQFEQDFRKSIPSNAFFYRFRDSGSTYYGGNNNLRFSTSNIADNMIFYKNKLYLNELKHHQGKSIPLSCIVGNKTKEKQIKDLIEASLYDNVVCNLIVFFSDVEKCYRLSIADLNEFLRIGDRKSIPITYFEENGIEIPAIKLRTNYRYNLLKMLEN